MIDRDRRDAQVKRGNAHLLFPPFVKQGVRIWSKGQDNHLLKTSDGLFEQIIGLRDRDLALARIGAPDGMESASQDFLYGDNGDRLSIGGNCRRSPNIASVAKKNLNEDVRIE